MSEFSDGRRFLKSNWEVLKNFQSDQKKGLPQPPIEKPVSSEAKIINLPEVRAINNKYLPEAIFNRRSVRKYSDLPLTIEELSFLLLATQGVREIIRNISFRTVPSAGARHPFETYLYVLNVEGLEEGLYRYLPVVHTLEFIRYIPNARERIIQATLEQVFVGTAAVVFFWAAIPYRTEWRYGPASHKVILLDAGHICQNLYLACEEINAGTCAIAAYSQELVDRFVGLDGEDEFVVYLAPVGKK